MNRHVASAIRTDLPPSFVPDVGEMVLLLLPASLLVFMAVALFTNAVPVEQDMPPLQSWECINFAQTQYPDLCEAGPNRTDIDV